MITSVHCTPTRALAPICKVPQQAISQYFVQSQTPPPQLATPPLFPLPQLILSLQMIPVWSGCVYSYPQTLHSTMRHSDLKILINHEKATIFFSLHRPHRSTNNITDIMPPHNIDNHTPDAITLVISPWAITCAERDAVDVDVKIHPQQNCQETCNIRKSPSRQYNRSYNL